VRVRDRRRSVAKRIRAISGQRGRGRESLPAIDRLTGEIAQRAKRTVREGRALLQKLRRVRGRKREAAKVLVRRLEQELTAAEQILAQTDQRLSGQRSIPNRRVSLVDPDARPVHRGSPGRAIGFGYKARIADTPEGFVIADIPEGGGPSDGSLLDGAIEKARRAGINVKTVYADRGFATKAGDAALSRHGIDDAVIPRQGRASPRQQTRSWRRRYRFRNGLEGRISQMKRKGLRRTRLRGLTGAQTWVGGITFSHNLQRLALLS